MTVKQLIAALKKEDPNVEVVLAADEEFNSASPLSGMGEKWFQPYEGNAARGDILNMDDADDGETPGRKVLCLEPEN